MLFSKIKLVIFIIIAKSKNIKSANRTLQFNLLLMSNNININMKLYKKAIIIINRRTFNLITTTNNDIKIFIFEKDCLRVQVKTIKNCRIKFTKKSTAYNILAIKLFENKLWRKSK